jgi:hypothetical protein
MPPTSCAKQKVFGRYERQVCLTETYDSIPDIAWDYGELSLQYTQVYTRRYFEPVQQADAFAS